jgi:hypothetical protein
MRQFDSGKVQDKLINRLDRQEKQQAFKLDRFLRFKLSEIHNELTQVLLMERIVETDNPGAVSELILKGLKAAMKSSEFDFKYFVSPIRDLVPRPNQMALYMTQYVNETLVNAPEVIDVYGTNVEIYDLISKVLNQSKIRFDKAEADVLAQLAASKTLEPGSRDYEIALDQMIRKRLGDPHQDT